MESRQYNDCKVHLLKERYEYYQDQPYDGRNTWMKFLVRGKDRKAFIRIDEYLHIDPDNGKKDYRLKAHGVVRDESCDIMLTIKFEQLNLKEMEKQVNDYYNRLFND